MDSVLADFERWHAEELKRIADRTRWLRVAILGSGALLLAAAMLAWKF